MRYQPRHGVLDIETPDTGRRMLLRGGAAVATASAIGGVSLLAPTAAQAARPTLKIGSKGAAVKTLQARLNSRGYWAGKADGTYGLATSQAVMAVQKKHGLTRDGVCGPSTWQVVARMGRVTARTRSGSVIEIDLAKQLLLFVENGQVRWAFNTSTGDSRHRTPRGRYRVYRHINGMRIAPLGRLWRPKYFVGGYAIHGSNSIPGYPASHGCARVSNAAMNFIWAARLAPLKRSVWVY